MSEGNRYGVSKENIEILTKEGVRRLQNEVDGMIRSVPRFRKMIDKDKFIQCLIKIMKNDFGLTKASIIFRIHILEDIPEERIREIYEQYEITS